MRRHLHAAEALVLTLLLTPLVLLARLDRMLWPPAAPPAPAPVAVVEPVAAASVVRRTPRAPRPRRKAAQGAAT